MNLYPLLVPAGSDTEVIYNDGGIFGADSTFTFNDSTKALTVQALAINSTSLFGSKVCIGGGAFTSDHIVLKLNTRDVADRAWKFTCGKNAHASYGNYPLILQPYVGASTGALVFDVQTGNIVLQPNDGKVGIGEINPETLTEWTHANPHMTWHEPTHSDADGSGLIKHIFKREQSGGEETAHFQFAASHDGSGNDQLGKGVWSVNTGAGLVDALKIDSAARVVAEQGVFSMAETTTPTAITGYGAIYTTSDNELFFQSGDGVEHLLHGDSFSNIWFHGISSVEVAIAVQNAFAKINSFTVVGHEDDLLNAVGSSANNNITLSSIGGGEYEISYHGSITATGGADKQMVFAMGITLATPKDITNVTDDTVTPIVITSAAHGLENGDMVEIAGVLVNLAANGSFIVDSKTDDTFVIVKLDGSATTGNGDYDEGTPTGDVTIFYPGNMEVHRMVRGADFGSISATAFHILAGDDVLAMYVANISGVTNLTVSSVSLGLNRIGD